MMPAASFVRLPPSSSEAVDFALVVAPYVAPPPTLPYAVKHLSNTFPLDPSSHRRCEEILATGARYL